MRGRTSGHTQAQGARGRGPGHRRSAAATSRPVRTEIISLATRLEASHSCVVSVAGAGVYVPIGTSLDRTARWWIGGQPNIGAGATRKGSAGRIGQSGVVCPARECSGLVRSRRVQALDIGLATATGRSYACRLGQDLSGRPSELRSG
jgi:hypothetical protein